MKSIRQVDWKRTKIHASKYAHDNDIWNRFEPARGDEAPRYDLDDVLAGLYESPSRREAVSGRNRKQKYGRMSGSLSVAFDSLDGQPVGVLADFVEKHLRGRELDRQQAGYAIGLRYYLRDKASMAEVNPVTVRALLKGLAA